MSGNYTLIYKKYVMVIIIGSHIKLVKNYKRCTLFLDWSVSGFMYLFYTIIGFRQHLFQKIGI